MPSSFLCQSIPADTREHCLAAFRAQRWCTSYTWHAELRLCELLEGPAGGAKRALLQCIAANHSDFEGSKKSVAIVETMTANLLSTSGEPVREEQRLCTHNVRCWATLHGYHLFLHPVAASELRHGYSRPYGPHRLYAGVPFDKVNDVRHAVIEANYLRRHGHVLHIDSDTIALNSSRSLRPFLLHADAAVSLQIRENGEVAAATYLVRRSAEAACFLRLWSELGHATHRNPIPMLNTDNGVLLLLVARLLDEPAALACEANALSAAKQAAAAAARSPRTRLSTTALGNLAYRTYTACFVHSLTTAMLLHRLRPRHDELAWLRFYFPREGWHRSFEAPPPAADSADSPAAGEPNAPRRARKLVRQHPALTSFQPAADVLGHGWKQMGKVLVQPGPECAPLQTNRSLRSAVLSAPEEAALAVQMCWWHHPIFGADAFKACHRRSGEGAVTVEYRVPTSAGAELTSHVLNLTERSVQRLFETESVRPRFAARIGTRQNLRKSQARSRAGSASPLVSLSLYSP